MGQRPWYTDTIKTGKGNGSMEYELVWVREHIEVYEDRKSTRLNSSH